MSFQSSLEGIQMRMAFKAIHFCHVLALYIMYASQQDKLICAKFHVAVARLLPACLLSSSSLKPLDSAGLTSDVITKYIKIMEFCFLHSSLVFGRTKLSEQMLLFLILHMYKN